MMNKEQKKHINRLIKEFEKNTNTSSIVGFIADNNGMLGACRKLVKNYETGDTKTKEWLTATSKEMEISIHLIIIKIKDILVLLSSESVVDDDAYATLGVSTDANQEEVKRAYRKLSLSYHPDTAVRDKDYNPDKFIQITKAYHAITDSNGVEGHTVANRVMPTWQQKKKRSVSNTQRNKVYLWATALVVILLIVSILSAVSYRKKTMIAALQNSRGAFIPPSTTKKIVLSAPYRSSEHSEIDKISHVNNKDMVSTVESTSSARSVGPHSEENDSDQYVDILISENTNLNLVGDGATGEPLAEISEAKSHQKQSEGQSAILPVARGDLEPNKNISGEDIVILTKKANTKRLITSSAQETSFLYHKEPQSEIDLKTNSGHTVMMDVVVDTQQDEISYVENMLQHNINGVDAEKLTDRVTDTDDVNKIDSKPVNRETGLPETRMSGSDREYSGAVTGEVLVHTAVNTEEASEGLIVRDESENVGPGVANDTSTQVLQHRINKFLLAYMNSYNQKDAVTFTSYFSDDALENNTPFARKKLIYYELFESTSAVKLQITNTVPQEERKLIIIKGTFKVMLHYKDNRKVSGSGPIKFELVEKGKSFKIMSLSYEFLK